MNLFDVYPLFEVEPVSGKGNYVYDNNGTEYLDFYGGHAVISIGHTHPHYVERINSQLNKIGFYSNSVPISLQKELAEKLGKMSGYEDWNLFLCSSGAEAIENALKLASAHNNRSKLIAFEKAFHGRTSLAVSVTDKPGIKFPVNEGAEVIRLRIGDAAGLEKELKKGDVCAVIIEGIQGIGGIVEPTRDFLAHARQLCDETGTVLILDEIQSGYGRTGKFFAHQWSEVEPDLIPVAKGMGNGFPVAGVLIHPKFEAKHGLLGTTFGGNHLACSAALSVLEVMEEEKLMENALHIGEYLKEKLSGISEIKEIRGRGLMLGLEFDFPVADMRKKLIYEQQVFTGSSSDKNVLRILPPLCVGEKQANQFIESLKKVLA